MRTLPLIIKNTMKLYFRKKINVISFVMFIAISLIISIFNFSDTTKLKIGIVNNDNSIISEDMIGSLENTDGFKLVPLTDGKVNQAVTDSDVDCALIIPDGYGNSIISGNAKRLQMVSIKGEETTYLVESYVNAYLNDITDLSNYAKGNENLFYSMYKEFHSGPAILSTNNLDDSVRKNDFAIRLLGFFMMFLMMSTGSISNIMLQERRDRTFYRVCAAPVKASSYVLGNITANVIITTLQIVIIAAFMILTLRLPFENGMLQIFVIMVTFGFVSISLSMLIISFSNSTSQAGNLNTLIVTPTCMLGGVFWPPEIMPDILKKISNFVPQKWAMDAIASVTYNADSSSVILDIAVLSAFALCFILIAIYRIRNSEKFIDFI